MNLTKRGNDHTTKTYRKLSNISYSDIKLYVENKKAFYLQKILGEPREEKESLSSLIGSLVHALILEKDKFEDMFCIATTQEPTGQMLLLVNNLYRITIKNTNEDGVIGLPFNVLMENAIAETKYDFTGKEVAFKGKTVEKILELFESDGEAYYRELRANHGKTVVSTYNIEKAELIVQEMRQNSYVNQYINAATQDGIDVHDELPITFTYKGMELKSLIDRLIVDHERKVITPVDIKATWDSEGFSWSYLKYYYYIQAIMYNLAIHSWAAEQGLENFKILPMKYIVCDSQGFHKSLVYEVLDADLDRALQGFKIGNREYEGLDSALASIQWSIDSSQWNVSREAVANNGVMTLGLNYT